MNKHLFINKKQCATIINNIELTDDIKKHILDYRVYHIQRDKPLDENKTINQYINNYNTMNNYMNTIEPLKRLQDYVEHKSINLTPFERTVELKYEQTKEKLEKNKGMHEITQDDILEILDQLTKVGDDIDNFNVLFPLNRRIQRCLKST